MLVVAALVVLTGAAVIAEGIIDVDVAIDVDADAEDTEAVTDDAPPPVPTTTLPLMPACQWFPIVQTYHNVASWEKV